MAIASSNSRTAGSWMGRRWREERPRSAADLIARAAKTRL
jgi:hypothetical protein